MMHTASGTAWHPLLRWLGCTVAGMCLEWPGFTIKSSQLGPTFVVGHLPPLISCSRPCEAPTLEHATLQIFEVVSPLHVA